VLDDAIFNNAFLSCKSFLARTVSRLVPPHDVEDIVQETYIRVYQLKARGEIKEPRAFMATTARNLALDHIKRAENRLSTHYDTEAELDYNGDPGSSGNPLLQAVSDQEFSRFCEAVRELPLQCRRVFVLKKVYGYSQRDIAKKLSISESTVEKHVAKGMKECSQYMQQYLEPNDKRQQTRGKITVWKRGGGR
jgi:RNA polymerase sigma factor (sigma-70 family)